MEFSEEQLEQDTKLYEELLASDIDYDTKPEEWK